MVGNLSALSIHGWLLAGRRWMSQRLPWVEPGGSGGTTFILVLYVYLLPKKTIRLDFWIAPGVHFLQGQSS